MSAKFPPLKSWQFFHSCRKVLGESFLQKLYKRSLTQIYRWSADPNLCADTERNPLDHLEAILLRLSEIGRPDIAQAAVSILADAVGCELRCLEPVIPEEISIEEKCLDVYPVLINFLEALRKEESPDVIRHLWQQSKRTLDEAYEVKCRIRKGSASEA